MDEFYEEEGSGDDILELLDDYESFADSSDLIATMHTAVERYGLTPDLYELIVGDGSFAAFTQRTYPAVENLKFDNYTEVQIAVVEGLGDFFKSIIKAISNFFKKVWEWISNIFGGSSSNSISTKVNNANKATKAIALSIDTILKNNTSIDPMTTLPEPVEIYSKTDIVEARDISKHLGELMMEQLKKLKEVKIPDLSQFEHVDAAKLKEGLPAEIDMSKDAREKLKFKRFDKSKVNSFKEAGWNSVDDILQLCKDGLTLAQSVPIGDNARDGLLTEMKRLKKMKEDLSALIKDPKFSEHVSKAKEIHHYVQTLLKCYSGFLRMSVVPFTRAIEQYSHMNKTIVVKFNDHVNHLVKQKKKS